MRIRVKLVGEMWRKFSMEDMWLSFEKEPTVRDVLVELKRERGVKINLGDPGIVILVNGRRVEFIGGLNAALKHMDEITIMPIIAGGFKEK